MKREQKLIGLFLGLMLLWGGITFYPQNNSTTDSLPVLKNPYTIPNSSNMSEPIKTLDFFTNDIQALAMYGNRIWGVDRVLKQIIEVSAVNGDLLETFPDFGFECDSLAASSYYLYTTSGVAGNGTIFVINPTTQAIVDTLVIYTDQSQTFGLEYSAGTIWMDQMNVMTFSCNLLQISATSGAVLKNFTLPMKMAAGPEIDGVVYCVEYDNEYIYGIDSSSGQILCKFKSPIQSSGDWGSTQQGNLLVVSDYNENCLHWIKTEYNTGEYVFGFDYSAYTFPFRMTNNETHLFFRPFYTSAITIAEIGTGEEVDELTTSFIPIGLSYHEGTLWTAEFGGSYEICQVDMTGTTIHSFSVGLDGTSQIYALEWVGSSIWAYLYNGTMIQINPTTESIVNQFEIEYLITGLAWSDEHDTLYGSTSDSNLIFEIDLTSETIPPESILMCEGTTFYGLTAWRDKFIVNEMGSGPKQLKYFQNDIPIPPVDDTTTSTSTTNSSGSTADEIPLIFGLNANYVALGGVGAGLLLGVLFGGLLFGRKKK